MHIQNFKLEQFDVTNARNNVETQFVAGMPAPFAGVYLLNFERIVSTRNVSPCTFKN